MPANCLPRRSLLFLPSLRIDAGRRGWECNRDGRHKGLPYVPVWISVCLVFMFFDLFSCFLFLALCPCAGVRQFVWQQRLRKRCSSTQLSCFSRSFALFRELKKVNNAKRAANFTMSQSAHAPTHTLTNIREFFLLSLFADINGRTWKYTINLYL